MPSISFSSLLVRDLEEFLVSAIGKMVLICLLNISSAAEGPLFSSGVDLSINIAILGSWFASNAFLSAFLTV